MPTYLPKEPVIAALHDVWDRLDALLSGLTDADWQRPTCLPGWNVQAIAAHIIGTENMLLGVDLPALQISETTHPHVRNDIGGFNECRGLNMEFDVFEWAEGGNNEFIHHLRTFLES